MPIQNSAAHLGILFVHGIGEQSKGQTLVLFGEPLLRWLQRWTYRERLVNEAYTADDSEDPDAPAHMVVSIDPISDAAAALQELVKLGNLGIVRASHGQRHATEGRAHEQRDSRPTVTQQWVAAESNWAPSFQRPAFGPFAAWLLSRGPWVIVSRFVGRLRSATRWKKVPAFIFVLASILLALILQIIVGVLAVLAVVPWPRLRSALSATLLKVTGTLGDTYLFAESEVQLAAAVTRVRRDMKWLVNRCDNRYDKVVVVAHSQGVAIARQALDSLDAPVASFITLGQGLKRLEELRWMSKNWQGLYSLLGFALPIVALAGVLSFFPPLGIPVEGVGTFRWALVGYPAILLLFSLLSQPDHQPELNKLSLGEKTRWIDFFASADPVSNEPLGISNVVDTAVTNFVSLTEDHTAYWDNRDQVVGPILIEIDRVAGTRLFDASGTELVGEVGRTRPRRVAFLVLSRWICAVSALVTAYGLRSELATIGEKALGPLTRIPLIGAIAESIRSTASAAERLLTNTDAATGHAPVGVLIILMFAFAFHALTRRVWRTWDDLAVRPLFQKISQGDHNEQRIVRDLVCVLALAPMFLAVATLRGWNLNNIVTISWQAAWRAPTLLALVGVALLLFFWAVAGIRSIRNSRSG